MAFMFVPYEDSRPTPNVVVDGAPNESTVLSLTHWPGIEQPPGLRDDLSAQMAFRYLDSPPEHPDASAVTNNHFDQDGLVSMLALVEPSVALEHRELLVDLAAAGDFGTYADRRAARASMTISRIAEAAVGDYASFCASAYRDTLPIVIDMLLHGERFQDQWGDEDDQLTRSEKALADGTIDLREIPAVELAIVEAPEHWSSARGHRFAGRTVDGMHPMAINNATNCTRVLWVHGRLYRYTDRYETWVQMRSRRPLPRIDLRPVADELTSMERHDVAWTASAPSVIMPELYHAEESSLPATTVTDVIVRHLRIAPPAWDPYTINR